jgi:hypothetical protein
MNMLYDGIPKSGRRAEWVFYMFHGKQCRRRYVVPRNPRTPGQLRSWAPFAAASKTWSHSNQLTDEQRGAWHAAGAKMQSHPRLGQSGPLTGQQHFVGRHCSRTAIREEMLCEPIERKAEKAEGSRKNAESKGHRAGFTTQVPRTHRVTRQTSGTRWGCAGAALRRHLRRKASAAHGRASMGSSQTLQSQTVPRPTWERYRGSSGLLPGRCRWSRERPAGGSSVCAFRRPRILTAVRQNDHWWGLWHGS